MGVPTQKDIESERPSRSGGWSDRRTGATGGGLKRLAPVLDTMPGRTTDDASCPVCGEEYDQRLVVERGDRWADLFPGSPLDFFEEYRRRCAARYDAERGTTLSGGERAVYFHGGEDAPSVL